MARLSEGSKPADFRALLFLPSAVVRNAILLKLNSGEGAMPPTDNAGHVSEKSKFVFFPYFA